MCGQDRREAAERSRKFREFGREKSMSLSHRITLLLLLSFAVCQVALGTQLKILVLDSNNGHGLHNKLVCISFAAGGVEGPVTNEARDCHRTDSTGTVEFHLTDPVPKAVHVVLGSNGLNPCYSPESFDISAALKGGTVAKNTCGEANTTLTEDGEVVVFAHQMSLWESMKARSDEF
jgi:hypothetical protein